MSEFIEFPVHLNLPHSWTTAQVRAQADIDGVRLKVLGAHYRAVEVEVFKLLKGGWRALYKLQKSQKTVQILDVSHGMLLDGMGGLLQFGKDPVWLDFTEEEAPLAKNSRGEYFDPPWYKEPTEPSRDGVIEVGDGVLLAGSIGASLA